MSAPIPANCSGLANSGVPAKAPGVEIAAEIDNFRRDQAVILQTHQDVARLDIAVN
jgi:hypothetical protein